MANKVPTGMALMMKSFGFDPEEIQKQALLFFELVKEFGQRLERIEKKLEHIGENGDGKQSGNAGGPGDAYSPKPITIPGTVSGPERADS